MSQHRSAIAPPARRGAQRGRHLALLIALALALSMLVAIPAASAKTLDCRKAKFTGWGGGSNHPCLQTKEGSGPYKGKYAIGGTNQADVIQGTLVSAGDIIRGHNGNDRLIGERGNDVLLGGNGNDRLDGSGDDDLLAGGNGDDTLAADAGSDRLQGGPGNDRYVVPKKSHVISDASGSDTLIMSVPLPSVKFEESGNDLILRHPGGGVTIKDHFGAGRIEVANFADGDRLRFSGRKVTLGGPSAAEVIGDQKGGENNREREQRIERELTRDFDEEVVFDVTFFCCGNDQRVEFGVTINGNRYNIPEVVRTIIDTVRDYLGGDDKHRGGGDGGSDNDDGDFDNDGIPDVHDPELRDPDTGDQYDSCRRC